MKETPLFHNTNFKNILVKSLSGVIFRYIRKINLNPLKTKALNFSKKRHPLMNCNIKINNVKLKAEKSVKFLGVIFDHKLTFEDHIREKINNTKHIISNYYSLRRK